MGCEELRKDFPLYLRHQLSQKQVGILEEHLCICEECRNFLGNLLDNKEQLNDFIATSEAEEKIVQKPKKDISQAFSYILIFLATLMIFGLGFLVLQSQKFTPR